LKLWEKKGMQGWIKRYEKNMTTEKNTIIKWKFQRGITEEEKDAAIKAGLAKISNYAGVKHSSASEIATKTGDIFNTSKFLGHRSGIQNTMKHTERRDIEKLRKLQDEIVIPPTLISN